MKDQFKTATTRDKQAQEYFSSDEFLALMRDNVKIALVNQGGTRAYISPKIAVKSQDMVYIQQAFAKLKEEFPELDNLRWNKGFAAKLGYALGMGLSTTGDLIADTKKNSFHRRFSGGF
jgi:hypothetical protein